MKKVFLLVCFGFNLVLSGIEPDAFGFIRSEKALAMDFYGVRRVSAPGEALLELEIGASFGGKYMDPASYTIVSFDDPNYIYDRLVSPLSVSKVEKILELRSDFSGRLREFFKHRIRLALPYPLVSGRNYGVSVYALSYGRTFSSFVYHAPEKAPPARIDPKRFFGLRGIENLGQSCLRLMFGPDLDFDAALKGGFTLSVNGERIPFKLLHGRAMIDGYRAEGDPLEPILRYDLFLRMEGHTVKNGDSVRIELPPGLTAGAETASFKFNSQSTRSSVIHIDEYGFWKDQQPKRMYLFCWMSDFPALYGGWPPLPLKLPPEIPRLSVEYPKEGFFTVCSEETGEHVLYGIYRAVRDRKKVENSPLRDLPSENIYELDLSRLNTPGVYYVFIDGIGRSRPFPVRAEKDELKQQLDNASYPP